MRRTSLLCVILLCFSTLVYSAQPVKGDFIFGLDAMFGLNGNKNRKLAGVVAHVGYDMYTPKIHYLSIEPKVGAGFFGGSLVDNFTEISLSDYKISCFTCAISPKLNLPLNPDNTAFLFLENEFAFSALSASILDKDVKNRRNSGEWQFHYALKLGLAINIGHSQRLALWVGGSTLDFDRVLNKNIPTGRKHYTGEEPSYSAGISIYL